jgi:hypothetical protein
MTAAELQIRVLSGAGGHASGEEVVGVPVEVCAGSVKACC